MKSFVELWEELTTTADAGFKTGTKLDDDDARVPDKILGNATRQKEEEATEEDTSEGPEEDASKLVELPGDEVADKQKKAQPLAGVSE